MKKVYALFVALTIILASFVSAAAEKNLGYETPILLALYEGVLTPVGLPYWTLDMTEDEKSAKSIMKLITDDISIYVRQEEGMATEFQITTHVDENESEDHRNNMLFCMYGAMLAVDMSMSDDDAIKNLTTVLDQGEATFNGIHYRFSSSAPYSDAVAFIVTPAEE